MKKITIKSSVLSAVMVTGIGCGANANAGVFDQLAAVANSALPAYGRTLSMSAHQVLDPAQMEAGIREVIVVASDRVAEGFGTDYLLDGQVALSSDMRRARKMAMKLGYEEAFDQLQKQVSETVIAAIPATSELLKAAVERVEIAEPRNLLSSHDTAATDFVRNRVSASLQRQLQPLVPSLLEYSGASNSIAALAPQINFGTLLTTIVQDYILQQSIDGFFDRLELEESAIRQNPELRTTKLLKQVFG